MQLSPTTESEVAAVVVAAGLSRRMGAFKLTLPWQNTTVIQHVVATLCTAPIHAIIVVTGHRADEIENLLAGTGVRCVRNIDYQTGEMLSSIQAGLAALEPGIQAALICLGDQPQMEAATVTTVVAAGKRTGWKRVVAPSYQMRMGHPILLPQTIWPQVMNTTESLRAVLRKQRDKIEYLTVETPTVLADLDTPEDYVASQPTTD